MQFKQTHVTCYSITGIDAQIPRWLGIQEGVKKIGNEIYEYQVRLVNSIEPEYYHHYFERGIANGLLTGLFGKPLQDSSKALKESAKEKTKERLGQEKSAGLYLTVKIIRAVDLPINSTKYVADKGDFYIGIQAFPNERESFRKNIDGLNSYFINYARKPQAFKPGDEWHPFEAKPGGTWRSGAKSDMIWLWPNIRLGPIRNTACSTTWCGYRNIVAVCCEAKWSSA